MPPAGKAGRRGAAAERLATGVRCALCSVASPKPEGTRVPADGGTSLVRWFGVNGVGVNGFGVNRVGVNDRVVAAGRRSQAVCDRHPTESRAPGWGRRPKYTQSRPGWGWPPCRKETHSRLGWARPPRPK
eukprot:scaffold14389_cov84-Isochrysis_galbana.AAC.1